MYVCIYEPRDFTLSHIPSSSLRYGFIKLLRLASNSYLGLCLSPLAACWDKMPVSHSLNKESFIYTLVFTPWRAGSEAGRSWWKSLEEQSCSHHGGWEAGRKGRV